MSPPISSRALAPPSQPKSSKILAPGPAKLSPNPFWATSVPAPKVWDMNPDFLGALYRGWSGYASNSSSSSSGSNPNCWENFCMLRELLSPGSAPHCFHWAYAWLGVITFQLQMDSDLHLNLILCPLVKYNLTLSPDLL